MEPAPPAAKLPVAAAQEPATAEGAPELAVVNARLVEVGPVQGAAVGQRWKRQEAA